MLWISDIGIVSYQKLLYKLDIEVHGALFRGVLTEEYSLAFSYHLQASFLTTLQRGSFQLVYPPTNPPQYPCSLE